MEIFIYLSLQHFLNHTKIFDFEVDVWSFSQKVYLFFQLTTWLKLNSCSKPPYITEACERHEHREETVEKPLGFNLVTLTSKSGLHAPSGAYLGLFWCGSLKRQGVWGPP